MKMEPSPVIDRNHVGIFCNKIKVYLNEFTLFLFSPSEKTHKNLSHSMRVLFMANSNGKKYYIKDKQAYPTWYPPPSPWAKGLKPIGPARTILLEPDGWG
jgi:hypothetical protein